MDASLRNNLIGIFLLLFVGYNAYSQVVTTELLAHHVVENNNGVVHDGTISNKTTNHDVAQSIPDKLTPGSSGPTGCTTTITSVPANESFESVTGTWANTTGDQIDWTRKSGRTGSSNTGPSRAQNGSYYYYTEASGSAGKNKTAILNGPCYNLNNNRCILTSRNLGWVELNIKSVNFYRIHRSYLVNLKYVENVSRQTYSIRMVNGNKLPVAVLKMKSFVEDH